VWSPKFLLLELTYEQLNDDNITNKKGQPGALKLPHTQGPGITIA